MMLQHTEERGEMEGGGLVVALQNEFTEIFIYNFFLRFFCWEENEFYPNISANVELCQILHSKRHHKSSPDAKIVSLVS